MIGVQVEDEVRALPDLLLHGGCARSLVVGSGVIDVPRHHGTHIVRQLASAKKGLMAAHAGVVKEEKAPFPGLRGPAVFPGMIQYNTP